MIKKSILFVFVMLSFAAQAQKETVEEVIAAADVAGTLFCGCADAMIALNSKMEAARNSSEQLSALAKQMTIAGTQFEDCSRELNKKYAYRKNDKIFQAEVLRTMTKKCRDVVKAMYYEVSIDKYQSSLDSAASTDSRLLLTDANKINPYTINAPYFVGGWVIVDTGDVLSFTLDGNSTTIFADGSISQSTWFYKEGILTTNDYKPKTRQLARCDDNSFEYVTYGDDKLHKVVRYKGERKRN